MRARTCSPLCADALDKPDAASFSTAARDKPSAGHECVLHGHAFLTDQLLRVIHDHVTSHIFPAPNRTAAERLALLAVGGYGR
jgi:[protein-PII] uridylyltransferase